MDENNLAVIGFWTEVDEDGDAVPVVRACPATEQHQGGFMNEVEVAVEKAMKLFRGNSNLIALEDLTNKARKFGFPGDVNAMRLFFELQDRYKITSIPDHQNQIHWFVYDRHEPSHQAQVK